MPVGISICKKCGKEFKWKRNKGQNLPLWCSASCRGHKKYEKREIHICKCETCGKGFISKKTSKNWVGKFCSVSCRVAAKSWLKNRLIWKNLTDSEKLKIMKKRFESHVVKKDGCWGWKSTIHHSGYALIKLEKQIGAHVASWIIHNGQIPKEMCVCHKCDNPVCSNPDHLFLGSHKDNSQDMVKKKRHSFGEKNFFSKLHEDDVIKIKELLDNKISCAEISRRFNVTQGCVHHIKSGKTWKHITLEEKI